MAGAMRDIDSFCEEQSWFTEIHRFTLHVCSCNCSEVVTEALKQYQHLMEGAMRDIDRFCEEQSWLTEIHRFTLHVCSYNLQ